MHAARSHCALVACATGFAILAPVSASAQTTVTATWKKGTANWSDAAQWTDSLTGYGYPQNFSTTLFNVNFAGGTATLTEAITLNRLTMTGGTISGDFALTVLGKSTLSKATLNGAGVTLFAKGATTTQSGTLTLGTGRTLENDGTYSWASTLALGSGATFLNNGTVTSAGSSRTATGADSTARFINAGTFTKTGTGTTTFNTLQFNNRNTGTVDVQAGTLSIAGGGSSAGNFITSTGAGTVAFRGNYTIDAGTVSTSKVTFSGTGNTLASGATLSGSAVTVSSGGAVTVDGAYNASATMIAGTARFGTSDAHTAALNLARTGILSGGTTRGVLTVAGTATLAGGSVREGASIILAGTATQSGATTLDSASIQVASGATYNWANTLTLNNGSRFRNLAGGTVTSAGTAARTAASTDGSGEFTNLGTFTKTGTGTTTFSTLPFINMGGTVDIRGGTLALAGGGGSSGIFTGAGTLALRGNYQITGGDLSVANLVFSSTTTPNRVSASHLVASKVSFGTGTTAIYGHYEAGSTAITGTANFEVPATTTTLSLGTSGILGGTGRLDVAGTATLTGGTMRDAGHTHLRGATTQTGTLTVSGLRTLQNEGSFSQRGNLALASGSMLINPGTYTTSGSGTRTITSADNSGYLVNTGTFAASTTTTVTGLILDNTGRIEARAGTLTFGGPVLQAMGGALFRGDWVVGNGTTTAATLAFTAPSAMGISTLEPDASITLNGTRTTFAAINGLNANLGTFRVLGGRNFTVAGTTGFANSGTLTVGAGSTFTSARGLTNTGAIEGNGTIIGTVTSSGTLATGASPGLLTFNNGLTLTSTNTTVMELGGTSRGVTYDAINVGGTLTFAGTLDVVSYGGYETTLGTTYDLFDWSSATGMFTSINLPTLGTSLSWDLSQLYTTGMITAVPEPATCAALAGIAAAAFAFWRRRRSR